MKILCMGETLLRYSTLKGHRFDELDFKIHIGGSETNIAVNLSQLNFDVSLFTKLPDHAIGNAVVKFLKGYGINVSKIIRNNMRMGAYLLETGSGNRTSSVIYDRAYSAMTSFSLDDIQLDEFFKDIDVFIVSGITVALNETIKESVIQMLQYCKVHHITVVYDSNYRSKLWSIEKAASAFKEILPYVHILSAGYLDAENFLNLKSDQTEFEEKLRDYYQQIKSLYPQIQYITSTKRDIISSTYNQLTGYLFDGNLHVSKTYDIDDIVDRVGGGDAFLSGILYGLLNDKDEEYALEFGCASSVLKHTVLGDVNQFNQQEIETFMNTGVSRINR